MVAWPQGNVARAQSGLFAQTTCWAIIHGMTYRDFVDTPPAAVPQGPTCPHCGTRLADQASVCFMCGAVMQTARRRRRQIPWLDLALLVVIVGAIAFWWTRSAPQPEPRATSLAAPIPAGQAPPADAAIMTPVSYTHLTLPTSDLV